MNYTFLSDASGVPGIVLDTRAEQNVVETDSGLKWYCNSEDAFLVNFNLQSGAHMQRFGRADKRAVRGPRSLPASR